MSVYVMIDISVREPAVMPGYREYIEKVRPLIERHGGRYLVRGGKTVSLAGGWNPEKVVLLEFPDVQSVERWWDSEEYKAIKPLREAAVLAKAIVVEGCTS